MTKQSISIKTLLLTIVVAFSLLLSSNLWVFAGFAHNSASAETVEYSYLESSTETTYNFESDGSTSYPYSPSKFSKITDTSYSDGDSNVVSGVIDISTDGYASYKDSYKLDAKPAQSTTDNKKVLMINAQDNNVYFGYQTSSSTTLKANSFYEISVRVYTHKQATASICIEGDDFSDIAESQITNISTSAQWSTYAFYIATSYTNSTSINIQLYLGSKAHVGNDSPIRSSHFVLFDDITVTRLSGASYQTAVKNNTGAKYRQISLDKSKELTSSDAGFVTNGDFKNGSKGWENDTENNSGSGTIQYESLNQQLQINSDKVTFGTHQSTDGNTNGVVISAKDGGTVAINSSEITIKQHHTYRIALWAKGKLNSSTLNIKVSGTIPDSTDDGLTCSAQYTSFDATEETINGNWGLYEFYIVGNPLFDTTVKLTLGITSANSTDSGYVAVSDIRSYLVTSQQMSDGTSNNSNAKTVKMYSTENTLAFDNYTFNLISTTELDASTTAYPLAPTSWTAGENNKDSGVVNLKNWNFALPVPTKSSLSGYSDEDNVLMLNGTNGNAQSFTSATQSLDKSGYAKITFQANIRSNSTAYVTIKNSDSIVIAELPIKTTDIDWKDYTIYLHNYMNAQTISATLSLGKDNDTVSGVAYFDNVKFDSTLTEEQFNAVTVDKQNVKFDLTTNALSATTSDLNSTTPLMWTRTDSENAQNTLINGGIYDYRDIENNFGDAIENPTDNDSNMVMVLQANDPVYTYYQSKLSYSLDASSYYKFTVWVRTTGLTTDTNTDEDYTTDGELIKHGASVILTNVDSSFKMINTKNTKNVDEWTLYTMYIYTTESITSNIQLGLGCSGMATKGTAYFANLNLTSLTEDDYKNEILNYDSENLPSNVLLATNVPEDEEENASQSGKFDPFAFSTIVIAIAVIFAVIGLTIKKVKQNAPKKSKKVSNNYDRLQTLMKDVDRRERKTAINHKLKLLKEELEQSQTFLAQEIDDLRKQTESYNTAKEIALDNPSIELEAPDVKQIQKEIQVQTAKIKQIEEDIAILEDEKERIEAQNKKSIEKRNVSKNNKSK